MNLKPSNVVIDINDNALLIDISGIGGVELTKAISKLEEFKLE